MRRERTPQDQRIGPGSLEQNRGNGRASRPRCPVLAMALLCAVGEVVLSLPALAQKVDQPPRVDHAAVLLPSERPRVQQVQFLRRADQVPSLRDAHVELGDDGVLIVSDQPEPSAAKPTANVPIQVSDARHPLPVQGPMLPGPVPRQGRVRDEELLTEKPERIEGPVAAKEIALPQQLQQPLSLLPVPALQDELQRVEESGWPVLVSPPVVESEHRPGAVRPAIANLPLLPSYAETLFDRARQQAEQAKSIDDLDRALRQCEEARYTQPEPQVEQAIDRLVAWIYNRRGELHAAAGDERAAFNDFQEAVLCDEQCWMALHNRAVTLASYQRQEEALADFDRVVELAPAFAIAHYNRGELYSQRHQWREAIDDYTAALDQLPEEANLYLARAYAWHQLKEFRQAVRDYNQALRLEPNSAPALAARARLYAEQGLYEQAIADFQYSLEADPRSATTYQSVAWLLATCPVDRFRDVGQAVEAAQRAHRLGKEDDPLVFDTLAAAYANAGNFPLAIVYQQQAMALAEAEQRPVYEARLALYRQDRPYRASLVRR